MGLLKSYRRVWKIHFLPPDVWRTLCDVCVCVCVHWWLSYITNNRNFYLKCFIREKHKQNRNRWILSIPHHKVAYITLLLSSSLSLSLSLSVSLSLSHTHTHTHTQIIFISIERQHRQQFLFSEALLKWLWWGFFLFVCFLNPSFFFYHDIYDVHLHGCFT